MPARFTRLLSGGTASVPRFAVSEAHCHLGLGTLHGRTGEREQAQEHFTSATAMYREMDMRFWLKKAEGARLRETG